MQKKEKRNLNEVEFGKKGQLLETNLSCIVQTLEESFVYGPFSK